jgi:glycosyltransferase involved in cell wall biosynthesis
MEMRITQAVFGVFHHFALARELERRGHLQKIYSTWPMTRLKREGLPADRVETFPWIHTPETVLSRYGLLPRWLSDDLGVWNAVQFDEWTVRRIPPDTDALVAIAGAGLKTGRIVQQRGGRFVCDRGSTHQRYQEQIVSAEYKRWGVDLPVSDIRDTVREEDIYEMADAITVPSTFAARSYVEMGISLEKLHVIPYGAALSKTVSDGQRYSQGQSFDVLFAGGVSLRKGVPYLLQAFANLKHPLKLLRLAGHVEPCMKQVLNKMPLDRVEILGSVPRDQLTRLMLESDVLVLPSIEDGFGLVMAEAMASGCPVISSTNTGGGDLYTDGIEGFIVPIRDSEAIRERLLMLADDPELRSRMGEAALQRVSTLGGWSDYGDRWEQLLRQLTGRS